jgi:Ca-activated chloride channel family protein
MTVKPLVGALHLLLLFASVATAADGGLQILSPAADSFVSGLVMLKAGVDAALEPEVVSITFHADGKQVCRQDRPPFECAWDAGAGVNVHDIRAVAVLRAGPRLVAAVRTAASVSIPEAVAEVVRVPANVTDAQGRFVKGLGAEAFEVTEDGVPQEVSHLVGGDAGRTLVVAVDMSGSMTASMTGVRRAVKTFLASLRHDDAVTLLAFNDNVFTLARNETDAEARRKAVDRLAPWGNTALYDVILQSMNSLSRAPGRKGLIVFSDGDDTASRATVRDVERRVEINDAPVYMIAQGRGTKVKELRRIVDHIARMSGGRAFYTEQPDELEAAYAAIAEELSSQYLLAYVPSNPEHDGSWRRIEVKVKVPGGHVRARQGYRAFADPGEASGQPR